MSCAAEAISVFSVGVIFYFAVLNGCLLAFTAIAWRDIVGHLRRRDHIGVEAAFASPLTPPVSVILPAFNEETWIVESVRALLRLRYPSYEIVIVDDGSTDSTVACLAKAFEVVPAHVAMRDRLPHAPVHRTYRSSRHPHLTVLSKVNAGTKADAVNAGINAARYPYVCVLDADELVEPDGLLRIARPLLDDPQGVVATGGIVRIANGSAIEDGAVVEPRLPAGRLATLQVIEYFRSFVAGRLAWSKFGSLMIVSGAFGLFHRETVESVGGYEPSAIGEDFELVQRLYHVLRERQEPCRVVYVPEVVVWNEAPADRRGLSGQRRRWQQGLFDAIRRHRKMIANPRYGTVGVVGMPFYLLFELLGPVIEMLGYLTIGVAAIIGVLNAKAAIAFAIVAVLLGVLQSVAALLAAEFSFRRYTSNREALRLVAYAFVDNLGYRQWLAVWRVWALVEVLLGRGGWGSIARQGARPGEQPSG
jgi:cellulose synthase/poly-beta-1,6-N-acetylglucosamine synthase-like glycosyltransferase